MYYELIEIVLLKCWNYLWYLNNIIGLHWLMLFGVRSLRRHSRSGRVEVGVVLSESDVSVRLSRGPAHITRWLDAESKVVVLGTTSSKWPGLTPTDRPNCPSTLKIITFARCFFFYKKKRIIFFLIYFNWIYYYASNETNDCLMFT